ncbi:hypothetical protein [Lysinibacillus sphaericus]|uniref:Phage protein n=1 Tax=Lysinibacillus sphaericus OT4b.31 TaxID=1285586 RepID=R7Z871_LYSSH|nr:hypothetical protein [Lysinibacillus sphaericus]EON70313.1 hypothetical protein H131_21987 [Lysinibacillus sphaericus OT4b.31]
MAEMNNRVVFERQKGRIIYQTGEAQGDVIPHGDWGTIGYIDIPYGSIDHTKCFLKEINPETLEPVIELYPVPELTEEQIRIQKLEEDILLLQTDSQVGGIL